MIYDNSVRHSRSRFAVHLPLGVSFVGMALAVAVASCNGCSSTPDAEAPPTASVTAPAQSDAPPADSAQPDAGECIKGGCSGELCQEPGASQPSFTTCEYRREYDCYKTATCGRDSAGQCNWQMTPELEKCLKVSR